MIEIICVDSNIDQEGRPLEYVHTVVDSDDEADALCVRLNSLYRRPHEDILSQAVYFYQRSRDGA